MAKLVAGTIFHISEDSTPSNKNHSIEHIPQGALALSDDGKIIEKGPLRELKKAFPSAKVLDYGDSLILPTFIDTHTHFPQLDIIGKPSGTLLDWLNQTTFPAEEMFSSRSFAASSSKVFTDQLLRNGVGAACIFSSSHFEAADELLNTCHQLNLRCIIGRASMNRGAPKSLLVPLEEDVESNENLIHKWHQKNKRVHIALTPRYAPSCTHELFIELSRLKAQYPDLYVQTHHSENSSEIELVKELFPNHKNYLDVYDSYGLIDRKTILAHSIHARDEEVSLIAEKQVLISHCPSSNFFLGSGLFPFRNMQNQDVPLSLGTDIGAGTSFSMWQTMNEAFKVSQLRGEPVELVDLFYAATLGAARALDWNSQCGSLDKGKDADFQILDPKLSILLSRRMEVLQNEKDLLASLVFLADDRILKEVYLQGERKSLGPTPVPT